MSTQTINTNSFLYKIKAFFSKLLSFLKYFDINEIFLYLLVVLYPIIPSYTLLFGMRANSILAFLSLLFLFISRNFRKMRFKNYYLLLFVSFFLLLLLVSFVNGDLFEIHFISQLLQFFIIPLYIFVELSNSTKKNRMLTIIVIAAAVLCIFSLTELFGFNIFSIIENVDMGNIGSVTQKRFGIYRVESSLGQAIAFGIYLTFILSTVYYLIYIRRPSRIKSVSFCTFVVLFFNAFIVLTVARFPILVALLVNIVGVAMMNSRMRKGILLSFASIIFIFVIVGLIFGGSLFTNIFTNIYNVITGNDKDNPIPYRASLFDNSNQVLLDPLSKLFGNGLNGNVYFMIYSPYFDKGSGPFIFNSFDNGYINLYLCQGAVGLFVWLAYYLLLTLYFGKCLIKKKTYSVFPMLIIATTLLNFISVARIDESRLFCVIIPIFLSICADKSNGYKKCVKRTWIAI